MENKSWVVELETDPETGDLILPLNDAILLSNGSTTKMEVGL